MNLTLQQQKSTTSARLAVLWPAASIMHLQCMWSRPSCTTASSECPMPHHHSAVRSNLMTGQRQCAAVLQLGTSIQKQAVLRNSYQSDMLTLGDRGLPRSDGCALRLTLPSSKAANRLLSFSTTMTRADESSLTCSGCRIRGNEL
jgi:hypothetical protein